MIKGIFMIETTTKRKSGPIRGILFWTLFPLLSLLLTAILLFYLDMANGPLIIMILECIALVGFITFRIILRGRRFVFRMIPFLALVAVNVILLPLAKPTVESYYATFAKAETTEVLKLASGDVQGVYNKDKTVRCP